MALESPSPQLPPGVVIVATGGTDRCPRTGTLFVVSELLSAEGLRAMTLFSEPASPIGRRDIGDVARATGDARLLTVNASEAAAGTLALTLESDARGGGTSEVLATTPSLFEAPRDAARAIITWLRRLAPASCDGPVRPTPLHDRHVLERELYRRALFVATLSFDLVPFAEVNEPFRRWMGLALRSEGGARDWPQVVEVTADLQVLGKRVGDNEAYAFDHGWRLGHVRTLAEALLAQLEATPGDEASSFAARISCAGLLWATGRHAEADRAFAELEAHDAAFAAFSRGALAADRDGLIASEPHMTRVVELLGDDIERLFPDHARHARWESALDGRRFLDLALCHLARCALERGDALATVNFAERALACTLHPLHALRLLARGLHHLAEHEQDAATARALRERNLDALERAHAAEPRADETRGALALATALGDPAVIARWEARAAEAAPLGFTLSVSL